MSMTSVVEALRELEDALSAEGFGCACMPDYQCKTCRARALLEQHMGPAVRRLRDALHAAHNETREHCARMCDLGLADSFRLFHADGGHYSWWDYRQAAFRRNLGLRIDLILVSQALRLRCRAASIDREPRGWERASDHTPALLELADDV